MTTATLYSTWKQMPTPQKSAVYFIVIEVIIREGQKSGYKLLNLDGLLYTTEVSRDSFSNMVERGYLVEWKPSN